MTKVPPKKKISKVVTVHTHLMHVPVSSKNPSGITTRHQHPRKIYESLNASELKAIFKQPKNKNMPYPASKRLPFKDSDKYDGLIAFWCDYFNNKFPAKPPGASLDPNVVKALIASESEFKNDPPGNPKAFGIAQITKSTWAILQDPDGEAKIFIFKDIRQKDLKDPEIAIALATRWLMRKRDTATNTLGRAPTVEELILEYKGLLKSKTKYHDNALIDFKENYAKLIKK